MLLETQEIFKCFEARVCRNLRDPGDTVRKDTTNREKGSTAISYCSQNNLFYFTDDELLFLPYSSTVNATVPYQHQDRLGLSPLFWQQLLTPVSHLIWRGVSKFIYPLFKNLHLHFILERHNISSNILEKGLNSQVTYIYIFLLNSPFYVLVSHCFLYHEAASAKQQILKL